ncbi:helix-turn-helix domain-containing protein [Luteimicrobium xylanilyticum]|uniref:Putative HTH-type transcriptional regulator YkvN n=1 Tax=Luteimicrobium xylanilyticum TaxID=1133546 RepID=A0A5P9QF78_9MICO|nr:helix-turn-helix domain-containing protein [Luteimicrobium xylanilyticum]QFU99919.1 putative HTH-type transcriptional regulator YkvN [Luteimicrobium xylanilyticum]
MPTLTAAQERELARLEYNAFFEACPSRRVLETIGNKWACLVVNALEGGPLRHSEIARTIAGASQKMLTQTLRTLERDGIVTRTVIPTVPVRVDYELTDLGASLTPVLHALKAWSEAHIGQILDARDAYDARDGEPTVAAVAARA